MGTKRKRRVVRKQPVSIISDEITIPNHSGDHTAGTTGTPVTDLDLANKKYVDDKKVESFTTNLTAGSVVFSDGTNLAQDNTNFFWDDTNNRLGVGTTSPDGRVHIFEGTAGAVTANTNADGLVVEDNTDTGISIISPDGNFSNLFFGAASSNAGALIRWKHATKIMQMGTNFSASSLQFLTDAGTLALDIDSSQNFNFQDGNLVTTGTLEVQGNSTFGVNGSNTTISKKGNNSNDEFFIGTTGAFRVQRASAGGECFRLQIAGDTEGRMLGTSSGLIVFGDGSSLGDTNLFRSAANVLKTDDSFAVGIDLTVAGNSTFTGTGHDSFSDFVANEHIDWTSTSSELDTSNSLNCRDLTLRPTSNGAFALIFQRGGSRQGTITTYQDDGMHICPREGEGLANNNVIITAESNRAKDHDHDTASTNPTLFVHSDTDPDTANDQWISFTHDVTDGVINTGTGTLNLGGTNVNFVNSTRTASTITHDAYVVLEIGGTEYKFMLGS